MPQDWKDILQGHFSEELSALPEEPAPEAAAAARPERLTVTIDRRRRAGKQVTRVAGFTCERAALEALAKRMKVRLGVGGSVDEGEILLQGDVREKAVAFLNEMGHRARRGN